MHSSWRHCCFQSIEEGRREAYQLQKQLQKQLLAEEKRHAEHTAVLQECERLEEALQLKLENVQRLIEDERNLALKVEALVLPAEDIDLPMAKVCGQRGDVIRFYNGARKWSDESLKATLKEAVATSSTLRRLQTRELRERERTVLESEAKLRELRLKIALTRERYAQAALPYNW
ncbi:hypothetical protein KFL_001210190 [Klebsormidium nitens]|uniref:Uncharacterized protein n=1 Tax=Klebsormidium nitens TaxID=105231 RepID=A0A1Y1HVT4_KLENI|nr:hypothetical protein KFL_001210190 [Klebsormidium nitens]|eukprot:GAQ82725.1 hypothetical protein KFL_001210190 [Klebsormidium nitens]